jgi:hypothetical protein
MHGFTRYTGEWLASKMGHDLVLSPSITSDVVRVPPQHTGTAAKDTPPTSNATAASLDDPPEDTKTPLATSVTFCECGTECGEKSTLCDKCLKQRSPKEVSGFLYVREDSSQFQRYWIKLVNKQLYCKCHHNPLQTTTTKRIPSTNK